MASTEWVDWAALRDRFRVGDLAIAATMLTRAPIAVTPEHAEERGNAAIWAYPAIGVAVGLVGGVAFLTFAFVGAPIGVAAAAAIGAQVLFTGGLHEDGLADTADGFAGGADREARLEIMRDSRIGASGGIALTLALLARWSAIVALAEGYGPVAALLALLASGAASRAAIVATMWALPPARLDGLSASVGRPDDNGAITALAIGVIMLLVGGGWLGLLGLVAAIATCWWVTRMADVKIDGQTGDVLGAVQQSVEIAVLTILALGAE